MDTGRTTGSRVLREIGDRESANGSRATWQGRVHEGYWTRRRWQRRRLPAVSKNGRARTAPTRACPAWPRRNLRPPFRLPPRASLFFCRGRPTHVTKHVWPVQERAPVVVAHPRTALQPHVLFCLGFRYCCVHVNINFYNYYYCFWCRSIARWKVKSLRHRFIATNTLGLLVKTGWIKKILQRITHFVSVQRHKLVISFVVLNSFLILNWRTHTKCPKL